ncbi:chaperone NapD [Vannielia litorea]|uniref:Chaperone NapD n=1 Tax=Vannielia litorea TaxID=1217970 RepID=A0A1N6IDW3_9RHOB|nr:chaperone NapD [Vannielia litorea]SIO30234.1 periplasmic nitrate reductase chaperone NapD [Vannielia litorea]
MNICGCLVHVARDAVPDARAAMEATPGVEVHAQTDDGRLVVVVEDTDEAFASDTIMGLHQVPGVISLTLNYHHFEDTSPRAALAATQPET